MAFYTDKDPLHLAVEHNQIERVRDLLNSGIRADVKDVIHRTPLMVAAGRGYKEIAALLIQRAADVNAKDARSTVWDGRCTALHFACEAGHAETVDLLLDKGADPDCVTECWHTPLESAICSDHQRLVELLLAKGASVDGPIKCAMPPVVAAALMNNLVLIRKLLRLGANPNRFVRDTALGSTKSLECVRELISGGADVNLKGRDGTPPLQKNLFVVGPEFILFLVESGANVNATADDDGMTALHRLAMRPRVDNAKVLIEAGANVNAISKDGRTPIDICLAMLKRSFKDNYERQRVADLFHKHVGKI